jgi:predicted metal-dependent hydrolase
MTINADDGRAEAKARGSDDWDIIPRDIHFDIRGNKQRRWLGNDMTKTVLVDGLSIFLPEGERFFIRSLKHYVSRLPDRDLAAEINGYAVQEAFHTREHEDYNKALAELGYDVEAMEKPVKQALGFTKNPLHRLLSTVAIEHLTATFSTETLRHPDMLEGAVPAYKRLWMWHALEEIEHKAVAYDVLKAATVGMSAWKRYLMRITAMNGTILSFLYIFLRNVPIYARAEGVKTGVRFWMRFFWIVMIYPVYWRRCLPMTLRFYLPGFDPRNTDDKELVQRGREWLAAEMPEYAGAALPAKG